MGEVIIRVGRPVAAARAALTLAGANAGRGLARTRPANIMLAAAALAAGLTVTACSPSFSPGGQGGQGGQGGGQGAASPAGQTGGDPGCQAVASQDSTISSQLSATSGNYS